MQTTTLKIQGMTCGGCVNSVRTVLEKLPGVGQVAVSLENAEAVIQHDPVHTSIDRLKAAISDAGFDIAD
ncbi:MAG: heavy-metal-associated domain-containing protein [Nitrosomonas sp.]|nr:heavy-metal-associated domain-containing protein [Nitrosomonas sp.]